MTLLIVIYSNDPETIWNALRLANCSLAYDNKVKVFLLGKGVEAATVSTLQYDVVEQLALFAENAGQLIGCGVCCENRKTEMPFLLEELKCELGSMNQLHGLIAEADKVLTF